VKLASTQKGICSGHVMQSNGSILQKSLIRKLPNGNGDGDVKGLGRVSVAVSVLAKSLIIKRT